MIAEDFVLQLALKLPQLTDEFTDSLAVTSLTRAGTTVTVETDAVHNLAPDQGVSIVGALTPILISSLTRVIGIGTLVTDADHDITLGSQDTVELDGSTEAEFNGTFTILSVPNRRTVTFTMDDSGATTATGDPLLLDGSSVLQGYNGIFPVATVPTPTSFTYEVTDSTLFTPASGTITAQANARISAAINFERALDAYDQHPAPSNWLFVVMEDANASKNRRELSDAVSDTQRQQYFQQKVIEGVSLYFFTPTGTDQIAGRQGGDLARTLFIPICQSILFHRFDSGYFVGEYNPLQFVSHGFHAYNTATYMHRYSFEQVSPLLFEDTIGASEDVAFRDIDFSMALDVGTQIEKLTAAINLDEDPI